MPVDVGNGQVYYPATMNADGSINPGVITTPGPPDANISLTPAEDTMSSLTSSSNTCTPSNPLGLPPGTAQLSNPDPFASTTPPDDSQACETCAVKQKVSGGIVYANATTTMKGTTGGFGLQTPGGPSFSNQICSSPLTIGSPGGPSLTAGAGVAGYSTTASASWTGAALQVCSPVYGTPTSWVPNGNVGIGGIPITSR